jgi:hypothetical protein
MLENYEHIIITIFVLSIQLHEYYEAAMDEYILIFCVENLNDSLTEFIFSSNWTVGTATAYT